MAGSYELTDTEKEPDTQKCIHSELLRLACEIPIGDVMGNRNEYLGYEVMAVCSQALVGWLDWTGKRDSP